MDSGEKNHVFTFHHNSDCEAWKRKEGEKGKYRSIVLIDCLLVGLSDHLLEMVFLVLERANETLLTRT